MSDEHRPFALPRFYPIIDASLLARRGIEVGSFAHDLKDAGARLIQYRDKDGTMEQVVRNVARLDVILLGSECSLILNDYLGVAAHTEFDGVHLGQQDLSPKVARELLGADRIIGVSTHNEEQVVAADAGCADYIAIGPVFATSSKADVDPVIGLEGVRRLRSLTRKPLVAIGGITRANCLAVIEAGADSVAVISELLPLTGESARKVAEDFLRLLR